MQQLTNKLLNKVLINKDQGYAFYFKDQFVELKKTNGLAKVTDKSSFIDFDTNFRLASVTKQFIAYGIMKLVLENKLSLTTNIKDLFDDLPAYFSSITITHLLNHTSGILDYENMPHHDDDPQIHDKDILAFLKTTTNTYFTPGAKYQYSNTAYILLGLIIEKVTNMPIDVYLQKNIFDKAAMENTKVNYEGLTQIKKRAYGHLLIDNKLILKDQYWCSATIGDGGIYANVNDLIKWINFLFDNYDKLNDTMFKTTYLKDNTDIKYGYGIRVINYHNHKILYHCGDTIGTNTFIMFSKTLDLKIIFLTNLGNIDTDVIKDNVLEYLKELEDKTNV